MPHICIVVLLGQARSQTCVPGGGGKIFSGESRGTKPQHLFHALCNQIQVHVCAEKVEFSSTSRKVELSQNFRGYLL